MDFGLKVGQVSLLDPELLAFLAPRLIFLEGEVLPKDVVLEVLICIHHYFVD